MADVYLRRDLIVVVWLVLLGRMTALFGHVPQDNVDKGVLHQREEHEHHTRRHEHVNSLVGRHETGSQTYTVFAQIIITRIQIFVRVPDCLAVIFHPYFLPMTLVFLRLNVRNTLSTSRQHDNM